MEISPPRSVRRAHSQAQQSPAAARFLCTAFAALAVLGQGLSFGLYSEGDWLPTFGGKPGLGGTPAIVTHDDGSGKALYFGGGFSSAGGVLASAVVRWDGTTWSALGRGLYKSDGSPGSVWAFAQTHSATGPELIAAGKFDSTGGAPANNVATWNGKEWRALGQGISGVIYDLELFDDGAQRLLYAAGSFGGGGSPSYGLARWDGVNWSPVPNGPAGTVRAMTLWPDSQGERLVVGGSFVSAGGQTVAHIASFDGSLWSPLGEGVGGIANPEVRALLVGDMGEGPRLFVGGTFTTAGGNFAPRVASWDGSNWAEMFGGADGPVQAFAMRQGPLGPELCAAGAFNNIGYAPMGGAARWNGQFWEPFGNSHNGSKLAFGEWESETGTQFLLGALMLGEGNLWKPLDAEVLGLNGPVRAVATADLGQGEELYLGGTFTHGQGVLLRGITRWSNGTFHPLGLGVSGQAPGGVLALLPHDDGSGMALYVGGNFTSGGAAGTGFITRWNGSAWSSVGGGMGPLGAGAVHAMATFPFPSGPQLIAAGVFSKAGSSTVSNIARWDGTEWHPMVNGTFTGTGSGSAGIRALAVFDEGDGPWLYVGGSFTKLLDSTVNGIVRWNGASWRNVGSGIWSWPFPRVSSLEVHDDGSGPALYLGGFFSLAGGTPASNLARWRNESFESLAGGPNGEVLAMEVVDLGRGPELAVGGDFEKAGGALVRGITTWDGSGWNALGPGIQHTGLNTVSALARAPNGALRMVVGGPFSTSAAGDSYAASFGLADQQAAQGDPSGVAGGPAQREARVVVHHGVAVGAGTQLALVARGPLELPTADGNRPALWLANVQAHAESSRSTWTWPSHWPRPPVGWVLEAWALHPNDAPRALPWEWSWGTPAGE